ncbi:hypothetical protein J4Q44_G00074080 [Coregonus suidteri]|uniref:Uncharacterized protein n=1 Tax=Coregonus suidteri TaxID=861788 RepID=A0AAN8MBP3_9TELE
MILCFQLCGNSLGEGPSCFSITKRGPYRNGLSRSVWKNLTGLHSALTSTPSNTFGMNWNADCELGLIAPASVPDLTNARVPGAMFQHLVESLPRIVEAVIAAKGGPTPYECP